LALSWLARRREATEICYEILSSSKEAISTTKVMYLTNTNFVVIKRYLFYLTVQGHLEELSGPPKKFIITSQGKDFLRLLSDLRRVTGRIRAPASLSHRLATSQPSERLTNGFSDTRSETVLACSKSWRFMQSVSRETKLKLQNVASSRGTSVQELLRAIIIPEWLKQNCLF